VECKKNKPRLEHKSLGEKGNRVGSLPIRLSEASSHLDEGNFWLYFMGKEVGEGSGSEKKSHEKGGEREGANTRNQNGG